MAAGEFNFDLRELNILAKLFDSAKLSSEDRRKLLQNIGTEVEAQTQQRFDDQISPDGKRWQELAQKTRDYYSEKGLGHGSL